MHSALIDFAVGASMGGLALSAGWGLFWLTVSTIGHSKGTCSWRVVLNSLTVAVIPLLLGWALASIRDEVFSSGLAFVLGLLVMPLALAGLALRRVPGGRAGVSMLQGIGHLIDELLGRHHACGGCEHDRPGDPSGGSA